ncbi:glycosyltransferase family 4 protein [bacterium]|nr:glycosyltransferase family 4 protein [bacterium]
MQTVLHINAGEVWSGIEQRILSIAKVLHGKAFNTIFAVSPSSPLYKKAVSNNISPLPLAIGKWKFNPLAIWRLSRFLKILKVDILHTHRSSDHWIGVLAVRLFGLSGQCKIIRTRHNFTKIKNNWINNKLYKEWTDRIIAVAEIIKRQLVDKNNIPENKITTIHSSINTEKFKDVFDDKYIRNEFEISSDTTVIGMVGRLREHKDYPNMFTALNIIVKKIEDIKLLIIGDGILESQLKKMVQKMQLADYVIFAGKRENIPQILSGIDIFALSSSVEGSPAAIKEALIMEKPIVSTNVGGIPEIIQNGITGVLVSPHNPEALANAILDTINSRDKALAMAKKGKQVLINKFSETRLAKLTAEVYQEHG